MPCLSSIMVETEVNLRRGVAAVALRGPPADKHGLVERETRGYQSVLLGLPDRRLFFPGHVDARLFARMRRQNVRRAAAGGARGGRCASAGGAGRSDALGEPLEAKSRAAPAVPRIVNLSHVINTLASWQNEEFTSCGQRFKWEQQFEAFQIPRPKINDARINSWMRVTQWQ